MTTAGPDDRPELAPMIPPIGSVSQVERMFRVNWVSSVFRSPSGAPLVQAEFVARQGRGVHIVDVREPDELVGSLGHIPGSEWIPRERVRSLVDRVPDRDTPIILVSRGGERSAELAKELEQAGLRFVASLVGGMLIWKSLGFATSRGPAILERRDVLREIDRTPPVAKIPLERADVEVHLGDPHALRWMKLAALLVHGRLSCVDGRDETGVIGTPGGDAGELLLGLGALESVTGAPLGDELVAELFRRHVDTFGRFYAHTDISASNALIKSLRSDPRLDAALAGVFETLEWRKFWMEPPEQVRDVLIEHAILPAHIGCGHLRLMLTRSADYGLRPELVTAFLRTFFRTRWAGAVEVELVPLPGLHAEGAVVNVRVDDDVHPFTKIPLVSPMAGGTQLFVNHPQVASHLRGQLAAFLAQQRDLLPKQPGLADALRGAIDALAGRHLSHTLGALAAGLPVFDVTFHGQGRVTVEQAGEVPRRAEGADASH